MDLAADAAEPFGHLFPARVRTDDVADVLAAERSDEPLDGGLRFDHRPVVPQHLRIFGVVGAHRGVDVRYECRVVKRRGAELQVGGLHRILPSILSRATWPSCTAYCMISRRPNFDAPSSRSRKVYGTSTTVV